MTIVKTIDLGPARAVYKGEWDAEAIYEYNNMVRHGGSLWCYVSSDELAGDEPRPSAADENTSPSGRWIVVGGRGEKGERGERGLQGASGRDGADGAQGPSGAAPEHQWDGPRLRWKNPDGAWSDYADLQGPQGPAGPEGPAGVQGGTGPQGAQGEQGVQGPKGDSGEPGPAGPQGETGPQGPAGTAATVTVGTVATGAAGSAAAVTNSGTPAAAVFDFVIPRGATGATGAQGPKGDKGDRGATGDRGADGIAIRPTASAGLGQWRYLSGSRSIQLPSGGTWAYFFVAGSSSAVGVAAGGSRVGIGGDNDSSGSGLAWRIA